MAEPLKHPQSDSVCVINRLAIGPWPQASTSKALSTLATISVTVAEFGATVAKFGDSRRFRQQLANAAL